LRGEGINAISECCGIGMPTIGLGRPAR